MEQVHANLFFMQGSDVKQKVKTPLDFGDKKGKISPEVLLFFRLLLTVRR